ncbi:hypothetical protein GT646_18930 [Clostridium butyricum]|uniref:hypothetical protein n=1 Tax=Clostridium butyricum TaxID=1492 RepID=UPI0013709C8F|nr:hypothetical protein [Clostridium butyricum]MZI82918.1 hypothetical protein [Clostridium butyricum]
MIEGILCLVAIIYTWNFWSNVQKNSGLVIFSTLTNYFAFKLFLCIVTSLVVAPIGIIVQAIKYITNRN